MQTNSSATFLRRVLALDAVSSGAMGLALASLAPTLGTLVNLPVDLIRESGLVLLPFAAFVGFLASRTIPSRAAVWVVVAVNAIWTIDSILLLLTGWVEPNAFGHAFIIGQALVVAVFAELQVIGLRKLTVARAS